MTIKRREKKILKGKKKYRTSNGNDLRKLDNKTPLTSSIVGWNSGSYTFTLFA